MVEEPPTALPALDAPPLLESWFAHLVAAYCPIGKVVVKDAGGALGRGLYALEKLPAGTAVVVEEEPLALIPDLNFDPEISCAHCLRPLGDVAQHIRRMLASETGKEADFNADVLNHIALQSVTSVTKYVEVISSESVLTLAVLRPCIVREAVRSDIVPRATQSSHGPLIIVCSAPPQTRPEWWLPSCASLQVRRPRSLQSLLSGTFRLASTDRLLLAATVLARVICAAERGGDLSRAWQPFGLMKSMPWERQLVYDDESDTLSDESATKKARVRTVHSAHEPAESDANRHRSADSVDVHQGGLPATLQACVLLPYTRHD